MAESTIEIYASEDWSDCAPDIEAACRAWRCAEKRGCMLVDAADVDLVISGLTSLANTEDEIADGLREADPEQRQASRHARDGLSAAAVRLAQMPKHR